MKLIGAFGGRVISRWAPEDVTPPGGYTLSMLFSAIAGRYAFQDIPNPIQTQMAIMQAQTAGMTGGVATAAVTSTFRSGLLKTPQRAVPILQVDFFLGTGLITVTTQTTEDGDLFLDDMIAHLQNALHLRAAPSTRAYASSLIVEFEKGIENQISAIGRIVGLIRDEFGQNGAADDFNFERITFGRDGFKMPGIDQISYTHLSIERRAGQPFEANRYYCVGPFRTTVFIQLLEKIEGAFS